MPFEYGTVCKPDNFGLFENRTSLVFRYLLSIFNIYKWSLVCKTSYIKGRLFFKQTPLDSFKSKLETCLSFKIRIFFCLRSQVRSGFSNKNVSTQLDRKNCLAWPIKLLSLTRQAVLTLDHGLIWHLRLRKMWGFKLLSTSPLIKLLKPVCYLWSPDQYSDVLNAIWKMEVAPFNYWSLSLVFRHFRYIVRIWIENFYLLVI